jgi:hypothetical protein
MTTPINSQGGGGANNVVPEAGLKPCPGPVRLGIRNRIGGDRFTPTESGG